MGKAKKRISIAILVIVVLLALFASLIGFMERDTMSPACASARQIATASSMERAWRILGLPSS